MSKKNASHLGVGLALVLACVGCGPNVRNATIPSSTPIAAVPDMATIVVVQPRTRFQSVNLLDPNGALLGQLNDRSHTVLRVPEGDVRIYAIPEDQGEWGDRIEGNVLAGRIYYATLSFRWGGLNFLALNPRSNDNRWAEREGFLSSTPLVELDPAVVPLALTDLGDPMPLIAEAEERYQELDEEHRAEHVLSPEDGL